MIYMTNNDYRRCFNSETEPECVFAGFIEKGVHCCTVDGIVQTRWYGCRPQEAIDKLDEKWGDGYNGVASVL